MGGVKDNKPSSRLKKEESGERYEERNNTEGDRKREVARERQAGE